MEQMNVYVISLVSHFNETLMKTFFLIKAKSFLNVRVNT